MTTMTGMSVRHPRLPWVALLLALWAVLLAGGLLLP